MTRIAAVQLTTAKGVAGDKLRLDSWIEVQLLGEDDKPIAGEQVSIALPGGSVITMALDDDGVARIDGVPPGICNVSFPDLDREAWEPIETSGSGSGAAQPDAQSGTADQGRAA